MDNLFSFLGIDMDEVISTTDTTTKSNTKNTSKKERTVAKKQDDITFDEQGNLCIITGYYEPIILNITSFEMSSITKESLFEKINSMYPEYTLKTSSMYTLDNGTILIYFDKNYIVEEFSFEPNEDWKIRISNTEVVLSTVFQKIYTLADVKDLWESIYPEFLGCKYIVDDTAKFIIPMIVTECLEPTLPATISLFNSDSFEVILDTEEVEEESQDDDLDLDEEDSESTESEPFDIKEYLSNKYPEKIGILKGNFMIVENNGNYQLVPYLIKSVTSTKATTSKNKKDTKLLYSTVGTTLSLAFTRFYLEPSMFGGKTEVTEDDLLTFLSEDYPEYSKERTKFDYDKGNNLIVAYLLGSKKGNVVNHRDTSHQLVKYELSDGTKVRMERNEIGYFTGTSSNQGEFLMYLPKLGENILREVHTFFRSVNNYGILNGHGSLEAACQIFYDKKNNKYFIYYPKQYVDIYSVEIKRNNHLEFHPQMLLVMDIHSHHSMPARFSSTDDADELGTRLYAVIGRITPDNYQLSFRAGTGGYFIPLKKEDLFKEEAPVMQGHVFNYNLIEVKNSALIAM